MTIDPDVQAIAASFNLDPTVVQAIMDAEGNILAAVQCSIPTVTTRDEAIRVLCRSLVHGMRDYLVSSGQVAEFVAFFGARWAPVGVANDPHGLNANWVPNVIKLWNAYRRDAEERK